MNERPSLLVCSINQALSALRDANYGQHILVVYEDANSWRELYSAFAHDRLNRGKESILILPYLETVDSTRSHLAEKGVAVRDSQLDGALAIIDAYEWFFSPDSNPDELMAKMVSNLNTSHREGATIIADIGVFFLKEETPKLIGLESAAASKVNSSCRLICCMNKDDFDRLVSTHKDVLIASHDKAFAVTSTQNVIFEEALAQSVSEAMSIYGKQISQTLSAYLEREHSIPPETLAGDPRALVDALENILDSGSRIVERRILRSLYGKIGAPVPQSSTADFEQKLSEAKKIYQKYYQ